MSSSGSQRRAAVDVGTNSVRLLVVDADGTSLAREMTITRLGQGVDERGRLDDEALARTLDTIGRYREVWEEFGVDDDVRVAATSAVRDAHDRDRFFDGVRRVAGVDAEVLSGEEEAAITYRGVIGALDLDRPVAVVDVGGGSTELIVGDGGGELAASISLQLGCVRLTERLLPSDPPSQAELAAAREEVRHQLDGAAEVLAERGADPADCRTLAGVAGTVTTLAALHLDLERYDRERVHGTRIPSAATTRLGRRLASMTADERSGLGPMASGREDVIVAGALVVEGVLERFGFAELVASEADILDGLVVGDR